MLYFFARGKFPENSYSQKLPEILDLTKVDNLYLQTPTNDITNISEMVNENGVPKHGMDETVNNKAYHSSWSMTRFAQIALEKYPDIKNVILINRPVRVDKMNKISQLSNDNLKEIVTKINNPKIRISEHNIHTQGETKENIFGHYNDTRNDGIHMNGPNGKSSPIKFHKHL